MGVLQRAPAPLSTPISDIDQRTKRMSGYLPTPWSDYFNGLDAQLAQSFATVDHVQIPNGSAAIGVTPITNRILSAGVYRVSYYFVELQADNVSSSATVTISWTDRSTARSLSGAAVTTNALSAAQTNTYLLRIDRATPITYAVAYTSTGGAPKMIFGLDIMLEQVLSLP
jgi:hypothetical protein